MAILSKETTIIQDIIFDWAFEDKDDWHDGLITSMADTRLHQCYEDAKQCLEDNGYESIPISKENTILEAFNAGFLKTMKQRGVTTELSSE